MTTPHWPVTVLAQLRVDVNRLSPLTVQVAPTGEVGMGTSPMLREELDRVLREQAPAILDVDLAGVAFFDCSGISALVAVRNAAAQAGGQVTVSNPRPNVRRVLELTGLLDTLTAPVDRPQPPRSGHPAPASAATGPVMLPHLTAA
jgi:anti-anti-sigma factor